MRKVTKAKTREKAKKQRFAEEEEIDEVSKITPVL